MAEKNRRNIEKIVKKVIASLMIIFMLMGISCTLIYYIIRMF